jgi:hypothetical protein
MITLTDAIARTLDSNTLGRAAKAFVATMTDEQAGDWYRAIIGSASSDKAKAVAAEPPSKTKPKRKPASKPAPEKASKDRDVKPENIESRAAVLAFVIKNPGSNAIQIGAACGGEYRESLAALVDDGKLRKEGRNRGTKYTATGQ